MSTWITNLQRALALHQQGNLPRARAMFEKVLKAQPTNLAAINALAVLAAQSKDFDRAAGLFERALRLDPQNPATHCNRGLARQQLGDLDSALASYDRAIALKADYGLAHYNRGNALQQLGQSNAALLSYGRAIDADPRFAPAYYNRGVILQELGRLHDALSSYDAAITLKADYVEAHYNRGVVCQALGHSAAALESYEAAIMLNANHSQAYTNRGVILSRLQRSTDALDSLDRAIALRPNSANAHFNRGIVQNDLKQYDAAIASFDRSIALGYEGVGLPGGRRHAKMQLCDWRDYDAERQGLIDRLERDEPASPPFHILLMSDSARLQHQAAASWMRSQHPPRSGMPPLARYARHERIRLGYYSADFHDHATLYLMAQLFEVHDRAAFDIVAFSFGPDRDSTLRSRVRAAVREFHEVRHRSDDDVALLSRGLEIDIAVDLKGLTQFSRPEIFARRAAPLQVSYLGYPGTMGADFMDYLIADRTLIPPEATADYHEKIILLPDSYQVNDANRAAARDTFERRELGLPPQGFVFCCFNNNFKITPHMFEVWMRIVMRVEGSVLWLYQDNPAAADNLRREARTRGVDPGRLIFASFMLLPQHLARHRAADLFLDTAPCNAHTTASDALWAGLPLLTLAGGAFASRVAASLLTALGLPELITYSYQEYEERAVALATTPSLLAATTQHLRQRRLTAPLFDTRLLAGRLEAAYRAIYEIDRAGEQPAHISIDRNGSVTRSDSG